MGPRRIGRPLTIGVGVEHRPQMRLEVSPRFMQIRSLVTHGLGQL
jgi:hypothetical protein